MMPTRCCVPGSDQAEEVRPFSAPFQKTKPRGRVSAEKKKNKL
jgi:hypothetical protein